MFFGLQGAGSALRGIFTGGISRFFFRIDARAQAWTYRDALKLSKSRNLAIMDYNVEGLGSGRAIAVSGPNRPPGTVDLPTHPMFKPSIDKWLRDTDSEYKLFEYLGGGIKNNNARGSLFIYTERAPCNSCGDTILNQFIQRFPNIKVTIETGNKTKKVL